MHRVTSFDCHELQLRGEHHATRNARSRVTRILCPANCDDKLVSPRFVHSIRYIVCACTQRACTHRMHITCGKCFVWVRMSAPTHKECTLPSSSSSYLAPQISPHTRARKIETRVSIEYISQKHRGDAVDDVGGGGCWALRRLRRCKLCAGATLFL